MSLIDSIKTYNQVMNKIEQNVTLYMLLNLMNEETQDLLLRVMDLRWDYLVNNYVSEGLNFIMTRAESIYDENESLEFVNNLQIKLKDFSDKFYYAYGVNMKLNNEAKFMINCEYTS